MALMRTSLGICLGLQFAAHAVMLGGVEVPKEKMVVYLLIGHSNMAGNHPARADGVTHPRAWNYPVGTKAWTLAKETRQAGLSAGNGTGGPGMPFLKAMAAAYPDYYFGVINTASPSSTCRGENTGNNTSDLDPANNRWWKGSYLYEQTLAAAKGIQGQVTLGGIFCMLGSVEATRTNRTVCQAFSDDVSQLVKDLRADLGIPNLPFLMGEYEAGSTRDFDPTLPLPAIIVEQTKLIPSKLPFSATVDSRGIDMLDDHHYSADVGQVEWAKRAIGLLQTNSWFPVTAGASIVAARRKLSIGTTPAIGRDGVGMSILSRDRDGVYRVDGSTLEPAEIKALW